ncbi:unnamed protein product, partial [Rotaria socialis]
MVSIHLLNNNLELVKYGDLCLSYNFNFNAYSKISIKITSRKTDLCLIQKNDILMLC